MSRQRSRDHRNGWSHLNSFLTRLAIRVTVALIIALPFPAVLTTLTPDRALTKGLLLPLAALGLAASAILFRPPNVWPVRDALRGRGARLLSVVAASLAVAALVAGLLKVQQQDRSHLEFYLAPADVTQIAQGASPSPFAVVINPHGTAGLFRLVVHGSQGDWSQDVGLSRVPISVRIPMAWDAVLDVQLVSSTDGAPVRQLFLLRNR